MKEMINESEKEGIGSWFSGIFSENQASMVLHQKCDFREIGYCERVGRSEEELFWDVVFFKRRSPVIG